MIHVPEGTEALIFDCDGTLVDTIPLYLRAWQDELLETGGVRVEAEWFAGRGGRSEEVLLEELGQELGVSFHPPSVISATRRRVRELLSDVRHNAPVVRLAREWAGRIPLAVASSGSREVVEASIAAIGLTDVFSAVVTVDDVVHPKPAPDIYLLAAGQLRVHPARCFALEDSMEGMKAARAAGMPVMDIGPVTDFQEL